MLASPGVVFSAVALLAESPQSEQLQLAGVSLGRSPDLPLVLSAALGAELAGLAEPAGLVVALESWAGDIPPCSVADWVSQVRRDDLRGLPVGVIAVGSDLAQAASSLAWLHRAVQQHGGYPVGSGVCVDPADLAADDDGYRLADVTLAARLALLGQRVQTMARIRRTLRAA